MDFAIEKNKLEEVYTDMLLFNEVCNSSREFVLMLKSPIIRGDMKMKIMNKIFVKDLSEITYNFFDIIVRKKREIYLNSIASYFLKQYNEHKGIAGVELTTAVELDEKLKDKVKAMVMKVIDSKEIDLETKVDEDIIAGFILKFNDKQYDASASGKLEALDKEFSKNTYIKNY
jgi:F-type H+-transporting ATPase subunit delta